LVVVLILLTRVVLFSPTNIGMLLSVSLLCAPLLLMFRIVECMSLLHFYLLLWSDAFFTDFIIKQHNFNVNDVRISETEPSASCNPTCTINRKSTGFLVITPNSSESGTLPQSSGPKSKGRENRTEAGLLLGLLLNLEKSEATFSYEMSTSFRDSRWYIPEDRTLQNHSRENSNSNYASSVITNSAYSTLSVEVIKSAVRLCHIGLQTWTLLLQVYSIIQLVKLPFMFHKT
jgi:hypothetical protein